MNNKDKQLDIFQQKQIQNKQETFTLEEALKQFEELKQIALGCFDKNGNPNIQAALRALENKAKIAGLYKDQKRGDNVFIKMNDIMLDGEQLRLNIGEDIFNGEEENV